MKRAVWFGFAVIVALLLLRLSGAWANVSGWGRM
jgi:hypothetical protein